MRIFKIFVNSKQRYRAIASGWSWPAFFFGSFWSIFSGIWLIAIVMLPVELIEAVISNSGNNQPGSDDPVTIVLGIIFLSIRVWFGIKGNKWREDKLLRNSFSLSGSVSAEDAKSALVLFGFSKNGVANESPHGFSKAS